MAYVAGSLIRSGHEVEIYHQDIHHYPESHLTNHLNNNQFDMVGLGFVAGYFQYRRAKLLSRAINESKNRKNFVYVLGGHGPSAEPGFFREKMGADTVIVGEGEITVLKVANAPSWSNSVLQVRDDPIKDIDSIPWPAYSLFPIEVYRLIRWPTSTRTDFCMPILTGRGCPYHCTFCYRMDEGFRPRDPLSVLDEVEYLRSQWGINHFQFSDELFMSSTERIQSFCDRMLTRNTQLWAKWDCNGRLNYATTGNLELMKKAGCQYINYGCEVLDDEVLKNIKKGLTVDQIHSGVEATIKAGIAPGLNFMWGNIGDTKETLQKAVDFLLKWDGYSELRTIRPVTPYPGSPLYREAINRGLLEGPADFYDRRHINSDLLTVNFTDIPDDDFHKALMNANLQLMGGYYARSVRAATEEAIHFYRTKDKGFRGFREV